MEKEIFEVPIRKDIVHEVIRYFRAKRRQPHKTKRMSELRGSNKKPRYIVLTYKITYVDVDE